MFCPDCPSGSYQNYCFVGNPKVIGSNPIPAISLKEKFIYSNIKFSFMALDPKKKRLIMIGAVSLVIILLLVVLVKSPLFKGVRDTITGMVIGSETEEEAEAEAEAEADVIKT